MKRMIMAFAALLIVGTATMAQTSDSTKSGKPDRSEIIKKRTEVVALKYGLNEEQKAKLLDLNTKYSGKMRMGKRSDRRMNQVKRESLNKMTAKRDSTMARQAPKAASGNKTIGKRPRLTMENSMQKYNEELKTIMTDEQFAKYNKDMRKRNALMGKRKGMKRTETGNTDNTGQSEKENKN